MKHWFGCEQIDNKEEAITWIINGLNEAIEGKSYLSNIFSHNVMLELSKYIDEDVLNNITIADVMFLPGDTDAAVPSVDDTDATPQRSAPIDYESVGGAIATFLSNQTEPVPFRVIREYIEIHANFTITQAQWNVVNKMIPGLRKIGERVHAKWVIDAVD